MASQLILGGITFDSFSTPSRMGAGGDQAMAVHKLPGGGRVVDTLGPDEDDIAWRGEFYSNDALQRVIALDAMRAAGLVQSLTFAGQYRSVIVKRFKFDIIREPVWIAYNIVCFVYQNPMLGPVGIATGTIDTLVLNDIAGALSLS
jgi:hypothetical protein